MARKNFRLGLCTGGGDCPGLNAAIRAAVRGAIGGHAYEVVGVASGLTGLLRGEEGTSAVSVARVQGIIASGGTILGTNNHGSPFRDKDKKDGVKDALIKAWKKERLDAMVVIGGDGTQFMARELAVSGLPLVGIPKTIDNDLRGTELTIGFATAVETAAAAALNLSTSADAHDRVMILEVMGRDAGHIALHAALASGADFALIPEIPFDLALIAGRLRARAERGRRAALVIVAEGAAPAGGERSYQESAAGAKLLGGVGHKLARQIHADAGIDARVTVLGHLQRGGAPVAEDRVLAARFAAKAIQLVSDGDFGHVVGIAKGRLTTIPYEKIVDKRRKVELDGEYVQAAESSGISLGRPFQYRELF